MTEAHVRDLGLVEYADGLLMQERLVALRQAGLIPDQLLLLEHSHVFTLGRRASPSHVLAGESLRRDWGIQLHESVRGGDVTYHGPGQLVLYLVLQLLPARQDVIGYVRDLEAVMIDLLADFDIRAGRLEGLSGAWVGSNKIGAIGVRMSRWVTSHGIGLNVNTDLRYFNLIVPCGIRDHGVTSLKRELGREVPLEEVKSRLVAHTARHFGLEPVEKPIARGSIQVIVYRRDPALELLCLRRVPERGGFWQPVTGLIEAGESPLDAARREVLEETGLEGDLLDLDFVHTFMLDPAVFAAPRFEVPSFITEHSYALEATARAEVRLEEGAHDALEWLPPEQALERQKWEGNRLGIERLQRRLNPFRESSP